MSVVETPAIPILRDGIAGGSQGVGQPANIEVVTMATPAITGRMAGGSLVIHSPVNVNAVVDDLSVDHRPWASATNRQLLLVQSRGVHASNGSVLASFSNDVSATSSADGRVKRCKLLRWLFDIITNSLT